MLFTKTIRSIIAFAMLMVFAFSITPQKTIHNFVANHLDPSTCEVHQNLPIEQVENGALHCTFDFQVATTPFVVYNFKISIEAPSLPISTNTFYTSNKVSCLSISQESRGPPVLMIG